MPMSGKRVLFYCPDRAVAQLAETVLLAVGGEPTLLWEEADLLVAEPTDFDVAVLVVEEGVDGWDGLFDRFEAAHPAPHLVLLVPDGTESYIERMTRRQAVNHVIARRAAPLWLEELRTTVAKLLRQDVFGLDCHVPWGVHQRSIQVEDSRDKGAYVREVAALAERFGVAPRFVELVETVTDELCTNAIFNAPRDLDGEPRYAHLNRREAVALEPQEVAELHFACDGSTFAVAVRDPFGSLTRETVVKYLARCLRQGPAELITETGGAGLGLYRVYRAISQLHIHIRAGVRTEMTGLLDLRHSIKEFKAHPKSLHFFVEEVGS